MENIHVFAHRPEDLPFQVRKNFHPYGKFHNSLLSKDSRMALKNADRILWSCGLDMTDESSQAKLLYLLLTFSHYRMLKKEVQCVFQGLGPIKTRMGKILSKRILRRVSKFVARDENSYQLIQKLNPSTNRVLAGDAIFMPGFEKQIAENANPAVVMKYLPLRERPIIAVNMRRWFHFSSDLIPFQLAKKRYESRGQEEMQQLVTIYVDLVRKLREQYDARILLVSAYNPGVFSWEDDLPWLEKIKTAFSDDSEVLLLNEDLEMMDYCSLMSKVDMAISMRLHSSLTVLRFGNPAINISYSAKGMDVFRTLGLGDHAFDIKTIMQNPVLLWDKVEESLNNQKEEKKRVSQGVNTVMIKNLDVLRSLFFDSHE
jgi:polysaccharide pyruvyl transferase WcaK-like protein